MGRNLNWYEGESLRALAMPLGGLGCGSVALCGDGGLRQWQIFNNIHHLAHLPHTFFALRSAGDGQPPVSRILMSDALYEDEDFIPPETANDHVVPRASSELLSKFQGVEKIRFRGEYPIAHLEFLDAELPIKISLEAFSPFIPLNAPDSGLPIIIFNFHLANTSDEIQAVQLLATLQNAVGWDGISAIEDTSNKDYGGNINRVTRLGFATGAILENQLLSESHPKKGGMALWSTAAAKTCTTWDDLQALLKPFHANGALPDPVSEGPSISGNTWNAALMEEFLLDPGTTKTATFLLAWHFPNRAIDWEQWWAGKQGLTKDQLSGRVGNFYSERFEDVEAVMQYSIDQVDRLTHETRKFHHAFFNSTLPQSILDAVSANISVLRSPTCVWLGDGSFHGFEGCQGKSTPGGDGFGGCCPFDCTHVWNYEMTLAYLFPDLERTMRDTEFNVQLDPEGSLPHRTTMPLQAPRPWGGTIIGGPDQPALDGELGAILKTYRELRNGAPRAWFDQHWPALKRLFKHIEDVHDPDKDGLIIGDQPNTYDISIFGANSFIGSLYLAALLAMKEMALQQGDEGLAGVCQERVDQGMVKLKGLTWNGEFFIQDVILEDHPDQQWGIGCHADQLLGQWWAHSLDLGYVLEPGDVRQALESIRKYNLREETFKPGSKARIFADGKERGLLNCTWPNGGRPEVPTNYSDEVWTGIEYEVAALLLFEGETKPGLSVVEDVRARYDGRRRNPWNEIECGDHYVRGMSSWTLLQAATGIHYNALDSSFKFGPQITQENFSALYITPDSWGRVVQKNGEGEMKLAFEVNWGELKLKSVEANLRVAEIAHVSVRAGESPVEIESWSNDANQVDVHFLAEVRVPAGSNLDIEVSRG
jgi:uncharacterized protein (DUF608 family)